MVDAMSWERIAMGAESIENALPRGHGSTDQPINRSTDRTPKLIGLSGGYGAGKDTAAGLLCRLDWNSARSVASFAQPLRAEIGATLTRGVWPAAMPESLRRELDGMTTLELAEKPTTPRARRLLQWWGVDYRRAQDREYWIRRLLWSLDPERMYVISDVRFANEARMVRQLGGVVWRIERPVDDAIAPERLHASERLDWEADLTLYNHGTVDELEAALGAALRGYGRAA